MDIQTLLKQNLGKDIYDASDKEIYDALLTMTQEMAAAKEHTGARGTVCWWLYEDEGRSALAGRLGGTVSVESAFGEGSSFAVSLPLAFSDGDVLLRREKPRQEEAPLIDRSFMSVEGILDFADSVDLDEVSDVLQRQIRCNMAIANEGLKQGYGANIGRVLLDMRGDDLHTRVRAYAAAGSDARMSGCGLPVIINSGSGNQGITASVPLVVWGRAHQAGRELLYRSLIVSNLITIHLKNGIGKLSAYCGVISAGCGAACGICYQDGGDLEAVSHTLVNALAVNSGVVCDGAKPSCAAKIASAIEAGLLGYEMYRHGSQFRGGEGIVSKGVENTIRNISRLAREGMQQTDREIIEIMTGCC